MNEASSKYVDQIATEKLLNEKLRGVHHRTDRQVLPLQIAAQDFLVGAPPVKQVLESQKPGYREICFPSAIATSCPANNLVYLHAFLRDQAWGSVIFVHGLYEDNLAIYNYYFSLLNDQGLDVYLLILPYHYERKPAESQFSGEYFWSGDLARSVQAYQQAVNDLYQFYGYLKQKTTSPGWVIGFSLGGGVALSLAARLALDGVFAINPVCNIAELVWSSALFSPIREDLAGSGISLEELHQVYQVLDPLNAQNIQTPLDRIALAASAYDQINEPGNYDLLARRWQLLHVLGYKAGHLNILRVPRLALDLIKQMKGRSPATDEVPFGLQKDAAWLADLD